MKRLLIFLAMMGFTPFVYADWGQFEELLHLGSVETLSGEVKNYSVQDGELVALTTTEGPNLSRPGCHLLEGQRKLPHEVNLKVVALYDPKTRAVGGEKLSLGLEEAHRTLRGMVPEYCDVISRLVLTLEVDLGRSDSSYQAVISVYKDDQGFFVWAPLTRNKLYTADNLVNFTVLKK